MVTLSVSLTALMLIPGASMSQKTNPPATSAATSDRLGLLTLASTARFILGSPRRPCFLLWSTFAAVLDSSLPFSGSFFCFRFRCLAFWAEPSAACFANIGGAISSPPDEIDPASILTSIKLSLSIGAVSWKSLCNGSWLVTISASSFHGLAPATLLGSMLLELLTRSLISSLSMLRFDPLSSSPLSERLPVAFSVKSKDPPSIASLSRTKASADTWRLPLRSVGTQCLGSPCSASVSNTNSSLPLCIKKLRL
mmetsp:Transcript_48187/g.102507  ORF Transcript_48187/g.102507 Transcript_48187/m.102507 type:complete len:253 (-) Transcript_48187:134-892(-)